jgi:hypothetical protein
MSALSEARAIHISPVLRLTCEDDIRHLSVDTLIREVPNHSGIDNAQIVRIPHEGLRDLSHLAFYTTWQDAHCHSGS